MIEFKNGNMPSVKSVSVLNEMSGDVLVIKFANGQELHVTPENDGFHFYANPTAQDRPTVSVMTHITGEHQPEEDKSVTVGIGEGVPLTVFDYAGAAGNLFQR